MNKVKTTEEKCPFCHGTGVVKTIDFLELEKLDLPFGEYLLNDLIDKYGEYYPCCEGCMIVN